jgi:hypothetical protein
LAFGRHLARRLGPRVAGRGPQSSIIEHVGAMCGVRRRPGVTTEQMF